MIVLAAMVVGAIITAAFGSDDPPAPGVVIDWIVDGDADATPAAAGTPAPQSTAASATETLPGPTTAPRTPATDGLSGFAYPIEGACLPEGDNLMPGAPREYRDATHEGVDFYESDNCAFIGLNTEVLAAKAGSVIRADWTYQELTHETLAQAEELVRLEGGDAPTVVDIYRGRQVWIDHGDGTVTRYAHLEGIAQSIVVGALVDQGELIAYVGESGTPESVTNPGTEAHLHFEIRTGAGYLGQGLGPDAVRALYRQAFSP